MIKVDLFKCGWDRRTKCKILVFHFLVFNTWWLLGPYGPIHARGDDIVTISIALLVGTVLLVMALSKSPHADAEFAYISIIFNVVLFLMSLCSKNGDVNQAIISAGGIDKVAVSLPLIGRFLTLSEVGTVSVMVSLLVFYSSFYFRPGILFVSGRDWSIVRMIVASILANLCYLTVIVVICVGTTIIFEVVVRVIFGFLGFTIPGLMDDVRREHGPGLSRSLPYAIAIAAWVIGTIIYGIYLLLFLPYKLTSKAVERFVLWSATRSPHK